jgi:hypothetical protein
VAKQPKPEPAPTEYVVIDEPPVDPESGSDPATPIEARPDDQTSSVDSQGATGDDSGATDDEPDQFPRSYVEELRKENAAQRLKAKEADALREDLMTAAVQLMTAGVLRDPADLPVAPEFWGEDGRPDHEVIREAAEALAAAKPYLARARGKVGQGRQPEPEKPVSLGEMMRAVAR